MITSEDLIQTNWSLQPVDKNETSRSLNRREWRLLPHLFFNSLKSFIILSNNRMSTGLFCTHSLYIFVHTACSKYNSENTQRWIFMVCDFHSIRTATVWKQRGDMNAQLSPSPLLYEARTLHQLSFHTSPHEVFYLFFYSSDSDFFFFLNLYMILTPPMLKFDSQLYSPSSR